MRGMGSRSARHTLIAVTGLVFCTLAPLITVLCFINGSLAAQVLVVNSLSTVPQTNSPSEVLCSDLRFGTAECVNRQKPWCGSVEAKETLWTYFQLTTVRCRYLYSYLFAARIDLLFFVLGAFLVGKWEKNKLQILMLCQLMNQSYRKNYSFSMFFSIVYLHHIFLPNWHWGLCRDEEGSECCLNSQSWKTKLRSCRFPRWSRLT